MRKFLICFGLLACAGALTVSVITAEEVSREGLQLSPAPTPAPGQALDVSVLGNPEDLRADTDPLDQGANSCPATWISSFPYFDSGTTAGRSNNFQTATCAWQGTANGPDVIYSYNPITSGWVVISTCGSNFNTVLEIRRFGECPGTSQYACSDWGCSGDAEIRAYLSAGVTYYIIVDGPTSADYGYYELSVRAMCSLTGVTECWETADSSHARLDCDGGPCNAQYGGTPAYATIACGQSTVGRAFTYIRAGTRMYDTDWYRFTLPEHASVNVFVRAEFPFTLSFGSTASWCGSSLTYSGSGETCYQYSIEGNLLPGTHDMRFQPADFGGLSTPQEYTLFLECAPYYGTCPVSGTINAPDTLVGTTLNSGLGCSAIPGDDATFRLNIPVDSSVWTISGCTSGSWGWQPLLLRLTATCCGSTLRVHDVCSGINLPIIRDYPLNAGTYYVNLAGSGGPFTLAATGCHRDHIFTAPFAHSDNTCGARNDCDGVGLGGEDQMIGVSLTSGTWSFRLNQSNGLKMYLMAGCCSFPIDSSSTDIFCRYLTAGDYYVRVAGNSTQCGPFTLTVERCRYRCCYGEQFDSCADTMQSACTALGGVFDYTRHCGTNPCPVIPLCPPEAQVSQVPYGSDSYNGTNLQSDITGQTRYDDFAGLTEPITGIRFWGFHRQNNVPCTLQPAPFFVRFRAPGAGPNDPPGDLVAAFGATLTGTPGEQYPAGTLHEYSMTFDTPVEMSGGWVSVYSGSTSFCDFYWQTSGLGNSKSWRRQDNLWTAMETTDLAFCLTGGGCQPADSVTLKHVSGTTMQLHFYAPQTGLYEFWTTTQRNTEFPVGFSNFRNQVFSSGRQSITFEAEADYTRCVITVDCNEQ